MKTRAIKVSKKAGLNPVARAVARRNLVSTITSYRINIFMYEQGLYAEFDYSCLRAIFSGTLKSMNSPSPLEHSKLRAGVSVTLQAEARGWAWDKADTVTLDNALVIVQSELTKPFSEAARRTSNKP